MEDNEAASAAEGTRFKIDKEKKMDFFDREIEQIENNPYMSQEEKNKAIREVELDAGDWEAQRQAEHEEIDRKYGY